MTPPMIAPRLLLLLLLFELWFSVELGTVDDDDAASVVGVTVGDDGVELAVADTEDDVESVSAVTEEDRAVIVVDDVGVA